MGQPRLKRQTGKDLVASFTFEAEIIAWRGPAPYLFAPIPEEHANTVRFSAKVASYGWGVVPVEAEIDGVAFTTSLFPKGETYLLPVKVEVQWKARVGVGDRIRAAIRINAR